LGGQPDAIYGPRLTNEIRWHGHNPTDLADNLRDVDLQVRTGPGIPDPEIEQPGPGTATDCVLEQGIYQTTKNFHDRLTELGVAHVWKEYGAGCHTIPSFRRAFAESLPGLERVIAHPPADPDEFTYRSIEPRFTIWGWRIEVDPARPLEFLELRKAGHDGVTLVGSGTTGVTTPPFFAGLRRVDVVAGDATSAVVPDREGRLHLSVALAPTRTLRFEPYARLVLSRLRTRRTGVRACVRSIGPAVDATRIALRRSGRVITSRRVTVSGGRSRCVRLGGPLRPGRYTVRATATDRYGHRLAASRNARLR
jgi:hypothetical protein